jgi:hypothetical protein
MKKAKLASILFFLFTTAILFLSFYRNQWKIVLPGKFRVFQYDDQSLVMSRLAESRNNGLLSYGGLLGRGDDEQYHANGQDPDFEGWYDHQYEAYLKGLKFNTYNIYGSQSGGQALFFGILDKFSPFSPAGNLRNYRVITSLSFAIVLSLLLLWFLNEFGWLAAIFAFITTLVSPWFTVFGRNLFYFPTFFYIPLVAVTYYLHTHSANIDQVKYKFGILVSVTVLLKCLFNGFDFILPSIMMIGAPLVYFAVRDKWEMRKFIQIGIVIAVSVAIAILVALLVLSVQIWAAIGDFPRGVEYLLDTFSRRTLGDPNRFPEYAASLQASTWDVLQIYFQGDTVIAWIGLRFMDLIFIVAAFTGIYVLFKKLRKGTYANSDKSNAFVIATWASILSPLLWFIIFKGQSYVHTRTNFLAWYMPFTLYGFALCGYVLQNLISNWRQPRKDSSSI